MTGTRRLAALGWRYGRAVRWGVAGLCLVAAAGSLATQADAPSPRVLTVAGRPVAAGAALTAADLTTATSTLPVITPAAADLVGEVTRGPLETGEPVTGSRIVPGGRVDPEPGTVVFPLTLADERIASLLQSGDRVDVLVTPDSLHEGDPRVVATDVQVLAVPLGEAGGFGPASPQSGAVVLLALPSEQSADLAGIRRSDQVSVAIR